MRRWLRSYRFLVALALCFILLNLGLDALRPVARIAAVPKNDFEKTMVAHPEQPWDKVFYGNSVVVSAFIEAQSASGYINLGIDYGKVTDLVQILEGGYAQITGELVIGLNIFVLMDTLETNKTYPWHQKWYEPYAYFERDRMAPLLTGAQQNALEGKPQATYPDTGKALYYGVLSDEELDKKLARYEENYFHLPLSDFAQNLDALPRLIGYCERHNIRLRAVWMPWNPYKPLPELYRTLMEQAGDHLRAGGVETLDLTFAFGREAFHDMGHLNYEVGAPLFTKEIEPWLSQ